jgi:hypothetical protein
VTAGTHWLQWQVDCYRCFVTDWFQNLATGQVIDGSTVQRWHDSVPNVNTTTLRQRVCQPLRVPDGGSLVPDGRFAIEEPKGHRRLYLERCGRSGRVLLSSSFEFPQENRQLVLWEAFNGSSLVLDGVFLPTQRRFTIAVPPSLSSVTGLAVTIKRVYIDALNAGRPEVLEALLPVAPLPHRYS